MSGLIDNVVSMGHHRLPRRVDRLARSTSSGSASAARLPCKSHGHDPSPQLQPANATLGGKQLWTDHAWRQGWTIQRHAVTHHYRLLDPQHVRWAWGTRERCQHELDRRAPDRQLAAERIVILLHGLMRTSGCMRELGEYLQAQMDCQPICFEYASTRGSLAEHAAALAELIDGLPPDQPLHFVGHSMGNIVVRHYLGDLELDQQWSKLERVQSVVMLGPPNQGASIARMLSKTVAFGWLAGRGAVELGPGWEQVQQRLATPRCPFGIIAGRLADPLVPNPLVEGEGDYVVSVEETRLPGAADMLEVDCLHSFLMNCPAVQQATAQFILTGRFSAANSAVAQ